MKKAFTLIELLIVIAVIAILAAILFPVFAQAQTAARASQGLSNTKQIGLGTSIYVHDNHNEIPSNNFDATDTKMLKNDFVINKECRITEKGKLWNYSKEKPGIRQWTTAPEIKVRGDTCRFIDLHGNFVHYELNKGSQPVQTIFSSRPASNLFKTMSELPPKPFGSLAPPQTNFIAPARFSRKSQSLNGIGNSSVTSPKKGVFLLLLISLFCVILLGSITTSFIKSETKIRIIFPVYAGLEALHWNFQRIDSEGNDNVFDFVKEQLAKEINRDRGVPIRSGEGIALQKYCFAATIGKYSHRFEAVYDPITKTAVICTGTFGMREATQLPLAVGTTKSPSFDETIDKAEKIIRGESKEFF